MLRNRWPDQIGMGGRMLSESVAGYVRIAHNSKVSLIYFLNEAYYTRSYTFCIGLKGTQ